MDDTSDGSSTAARRAPIEENEPKGGILSRVFGHLGSGRSSNSSDQQDGPLEANGHALAPVGGISNLGRLRVEDVAVPRAEIVSVPVSIALSELVSVFRESGLTRLPVFSERIDNPIGLIHLKDLALKHGFNAKNRRLGLRRMVRPLLYAPPSMPIGVLLQKMQSDRMHMALVIDEYGGVDGLVTIEDLIEQVVGEIEDEHDVDDDQFWTVEKPGVLLAQAKTPLDEFEQETGCALRDKSDDEEIETLGGLVFMLCGCVPARGEVIRHKAGVEFEVVDADARRIKRLRVRLPSAADG